MPEALEHKLFVPTPVPLPLLKAARALRGNMTDAEQLLWHCLRRKQLDGYRFRRQHPFERYVLDFYCCEAKLAVELDGGQHNEPDARARDNERTVFLEQHGIQVIRFWNNEVLSNIEGVLETIYLELQRNRPLPNPPPPGEGTIGSSDQGDGTSCSSGQGDRASGSSPQRGEVGRGAVFFTATFTDTAQLTRFDETLATIGFTMPISALSLVGWSLEPMGKRCILEKIRSKGVLLKDFIGSRAYRGITTGLNEAFEINGTEHAQLISEDPKSAEIIKPFLRGRDVKRWCHEHQNSWLIFTRRGIDIHNYPAIIKFLDRKKAQLMPKPAIWDEKKNGPWQGRKAGSYEWYEIQDNIAYWQEFDKTKILSTKISIRPTFSLDTTGSYLGNTSYFIPVKSSEIFLLALLNSQVSEFYCKSIFVGKQNGYYEVQPEGLETFPIPPATDAQKAPIIERVQNILAAPDSPDVPQLEAEIDLLVYALYDLTDAEIALVEGKA